MNKAGFLTKFLSIFFPERCPYCGRVLEQPTVMCGRCKGQVKACRFPIPIFRGKEDLLCFSPFLYQGPVKAGIFRFKFKNHPKLSKAFGDSMAECILSHQITVDCVTCVPLSKERYRERGYNQSELLARRVGETLGIPYKELLEKWKETPAQHTLGQNMREQNVAGAYRLQQKKENQIEGKSILLCDDIVTTGATLRECGRILLEGGAKSVVCSTLAAVQKSSFDRL